MKFNDYFKLEEYSEENFAWMIMALTEENYWNKILTPYIYWEEIKKYPMAWIL